MKQREAELKAEVERWLKAAEAADAEEDRASMRKPRSIKARTSSWLMS